LIEQKHDLRKITSEVLDASKADHTEVIVTNTDVALTRFANSEIHQNVAERDIGVRIRVIDEERVGVASTNQLSEAAMREALDRAIESARTQPPRPDLSPLAPPAKLDPAPSMRPPRTPPLRNAPKESARSVPWRKEAG
jgi:predicted Zn-dependent protease